MGEKPFEIGDNVNVSGTIGEITDIGYMSVRIRTDDNTMVRIPNETLVSSAILNLSHYPTRRITIDVGVGYSEDIEKVMALMIDAAKQEPLSLADPAPQANFDSFGDSAINLKLYAWTKTVNNREFKSRLQASLKRVFDEQGVDIPYPCRTIYNGTTEKEEVSVPDKVATHD
jgi:small-conductance mechanosensitive channel